MFPLMMIGGSFFPFESMPKWMATVGSWTPNGWMLVKLKAILLNQAEPLSLSVAAFALIVIFGLLFWIGVRRTWTIRGTS
jgi:ABC-type multidrug transport system permease subunit